MHTDWPLDKIDISACAEVWGLEKPFEYISSPSVYLEFMGCYDYSSDVLWLHPELVEKGRLLSRFDGKIKHALHVYAHEVAHGLAGARCGHDIEFGAIYCFLLARIPGEWCIDDVIRPYDVHTTAKFITPYRRGSSVKSWDNKINKYAIRTAVDWGWELAQDPDLTASQAVEVIRKREQVRLENINHRERIAERFTFIAVAMVVAMVVAIAVSWWIFERSRPLAL